MDIALWIAQVLLAFIFIRVGYGHALHADRIKLEKGMGWINVVPRPLLTFIGICEVAGGLAAVLPMASGILPWLTPLAAALLALVMVFAFIFHLPRKEYPNMGLNAFLFLLAAFVAFGRWG